VLKESVDLLLEKEESKGKTGPHMSGKPQKTHTTGEFIVAA